MTINENDESSSMNGTQFGPFSPEALKIQGLTTSVYLFFRPKLVFLLVVVGLFTGRIGWEMVSVANASFAGVERGLSGAPHEYLALMITAKPGHREIGIEEFSFKNILWREDSLLDSAPNDVADRSVQRLDGTVVTSPQSGPVGLGSGVFLTYTPEGLEVNIPGVAEKISVPTSQCDLLRAWRLSVNLKRKLFLCQGRELLTLADLSVPSPRPVQVTFSHTEEDRRRHAEYEEETAKMRQQTGLNIAAVRLESLIPESRALIPETPRAPLVVYRSDSLSIIGVTLAGGTPRAQLVDSGYSPSTIREQFGIEPRHWLNDSGGRLNRFTDSPQLPAEEQGSTLYFKDNRLWFVDDQGHHPIATLSARSFFGIQPVVYFEDQSPDGRFVVVRMNFKNYVIDTLERRMAFLGEADRVRLLF